MNGVPSEHAICDGGSLQTLLVGAPYGEGAGFASRIGGGFPGVALVPRLPLATGCELAGIGGVRRAV